MRGAGYLRSAAGLGPERIPVLRPQHTPAWGRMEAVESASSASAAAAMGIGAKPAKGPGGPGISTPSGRIAATAMAAGEAAPAHTPAAVNEIESKKSQPSVRTAPIAGSADQHPTPARKAERGPTAASSINTASREDSRGSEPSPLTGAQPSANPARAIQITEKPVHQPAAAGRPQGNAVSSRPAEDEESKTAMARSNRVVSTTRNATADHVDSGPEPAASESPRSLQAFATFAKATVASNWTAADDSAPQPEAYIQNGATTSATVRSGPVRNAVHIGKIDIQIVPPAEKPKPDMAPAPEASSPAVLSRGFTSWFGLRQG